MSPEEHPRVSNKGHVSFVVSSLNSSEPSGVSFSRKHKPFLAGGLGGVAPDDLYAIGTKGETLHFNGEVWRRALDTNRGFLYRWGAPPTTRWSGLTVAYHQCEKVGCKLNAGWAGGPKDVWAVAIHFDGEKWRRSPTGVRHALSSVFSLGPDKVWAHRVREQWRDAPAAPCRSQGALTGTASMACDPSPNCFR